MWYLHTREYHSDTCCNTEETLRHYAKWNKPMTKEKILYDSTYMGSLEESNSERRGAWLRASQSLGQRPNTVWSSCKPCPCTPLLLLFSLLSHSVLSISALAIDPLTVNSHRLRPSFTRPSRACSFSGFTSQAFLGDFPQNRCDALQVIISLCCPLGIQLSLQP